MSIVLGLIAVSGVASFAGSYTVVSPDKLVTIKVETGKTLTWSVMRDGETLVEPSAIGLDIDGAKVQPGVNPKVKKVTRRSVDEVLHPVVPTKFSDVRDNYNEMTLKMAGDFSVQFRAYDNGAAYRFVTSRPGDMTVNSETVEMNMPQGTVAYWPVYPMRHNYMSSQESLFEKKQLDSISASNPGYLPIYMQTPAGTRVVVTEAGVDDYANLFFEGSESNSLNGVFPKIIKKKRMKTPEEGWGSDRTEVVLELQPYMAVTDGSRALPWRIVMVSPDDASLLENYLAWQLSGEPVVEDASWVKPGRISWDWWSNLNVYGPDVDFEAGVNTDTYKYFIDFAAKHGFEYILLDEGWSAGTLDIKHYKPEVNVEEIIDYGRKKGVGVVLWALWNPLAEDIEGTFDIYQKWGVAGVKIDFMDRSDQEMVNFYDAVGKAAADRHLVVDFHGAYKPSGMQRKYPNVLTFEGVLGNEYNKGEGTGWNASVTPDHYLMIPFIRNLAGPMDFTPGAVHNVTREDYHGAFSHPVTLGTRANQAAMFVVFESPLQMICDSPSNYNNAPGYAEFLSKIPVTWDETIGLDAEIGDYLMMARRKGDKWYIAAMTDWTPRDLTLNLDFLPEGKWTMESMADGRNAHREATDHKFETKTVSTGDTLDLHLAPGGGWVAILTPVK
ncbi:MAG: glycoside hydrolase family 97 protein [Muribaculaceae bacterium]|nr:glycoside hydrolase family 97 protein [Muribaculaceae bacterium]